MHFRITIIRIYVDNISLTYYYGEMHWVLGFVPFRNEFLTGFGLIIVVGGCFRPPEWIENIRADDYKIVKLGNYPHTTVQIRYDPKEFIKLREKIEKFTEFFNKIVYHFYPDDTHKLNFEYKYAATHNGRVILRYFSRFPEPDLYAGYSLQFVIEDGVVKEIYLFKTPLE